MIDQSTLAAGLVHCEFRRCLGSSPDSEVPIARYYVPVVPTVGECINIDGNPYIVVERGWAVGGDGEPPFADPPNIATR